MIERRGERTLRHRNAGFRRLAVDQKRGGETGRVFHLRRSFFRQPRLAAGDGVTRARRRDRGAEQEIERQFSAMRFCQFERQHPAADRTGHGERSQWSARGNFVASGLAIKCGGCLRAGRSARHQRAHAARRFAHQPEAVAADVVHVRIDGRNGRRHRHHGLKRVAALGKDLAPGLDRREVRRRNDAATVAGCVEVHAASSIRPRRLSNASTVGIRPRNAL